MLVHWIWLATRPNLNERMKAELVRHFRDPEDLYFADRDSYRHIDGMTPQGAEALQDKSLAGAYEILEDCRRENLHILTYQDAGYPSRLKHIPDPPLVFYYKGKLPDFDGTPTIGIVGTREASSYGLATARKMGYQIAQCGGIVVSGMAKGIDACSMTGALTAGSPVVGILGSGADIVYPLCNRALFADVERYGCLLSEFPPGTPPYSWNFPKRNRIISGLSCGVLVVEAPEGSGALITADRAMNQGRDVFVIPGNIDQPGFVGSTQLIRDGATLVTSGWDVISEYEALYPDKIRKDTAPTRQWACPDEGLAAQKEENRGKVAQKPRLLKVNSEKKEKSNKKDVDNPPQPTYSDVNKDLPMLSTEEKAIVDALKDGEQLVDDVITAVQLPANKVAAAITMLTIKGVVKKLPGNRISLF